MRTLKYISLFIITALFAACGGPSGDGTPPTQFTDDATSGACSVSADESYSLILGAEEQAFESIYVDAKVNVVFRPEGDLVKDLMRPGDSTRWIMISRELNEQEKKFFESKNSHPQVIKIAYDAVAIIANKENTKDSLTIDQIKQVLSQKLITWKQLDKHQGDDTINIVFDNRQSGNARFIKERFLNNADVFPKNCYAVNSNADVINYVKDHKNALGVIGVNWISDKDDSTTKEIMKKIKVMSIESDTTPGLYYKPYQAYIAQHVYPLSRTVYIISREGRMGLGTGFAHYIAGDKGQRIILKSGLVPATMPVRLVNINKE